MEGNEKTLITQKFVQLKINLKKIVVGKKYVLGQNV